MARNALQKTLERKKAAKQELSPQISMSDPSKEPLLLVFAPRDTAKQKLFFQVLEGCLVLPCSTIVISDTEKEDVPRHTSGKILWMSSDEAKVERSLEAADMAVLFEENESLLKQLVDSGIVVIGHEKSPLIENYNPNKESGTGFTFNDYNPWAIFTALVRAHETFRFPYDWQHIIRNVLSKSTGA